MTLNPKYLSFRGPPVDDSEILDRLPSDYRYLLGDTNGFTMFDGGLHIRGACLQPEWHSVRKAWEGEHALHLLYPSVLPQDVPLGEDCMGDQFILRQGIVHKLAAETGALSSLGVSLTAFFEEAQKHPVDYLALHPLIQFHREQGRYLHPGELLSAEPLFCMADSGKGVHLEAVPSQKWISFLAYVAGQLAKLPNGTKVRFKFVDK
jgi:hypothetical protein